MSASAAADLATRCLACLGSGELDALAGLFAPDAAWELAYEPGEITGGRRTVRGAERIAKFHRRLMDTVARVAFSDVQAWGVDPELALVTFRSEATTHGGHEYANRYPCQVRASDGLITHWLEFFDPRPAEAIREEMAAA